MKYIARSVLIVLLLTAASFTSHAQEVAMGEASTQNLIKGKLAAYLPYWVSKEQVEEELGKLKIDISEIHMKPGFIFVKNEETKELAEVFANSELVELVHNTTHHQWKRDILILEQKEDKTEEEERRLEVLKSIVNEHSFRAQFKMNIDRHDAVRFINSLNREINYSLHFDTRYVVVNVPADKELEYEDKLNDLSFVDFVTYVAQAGN